MAAPAVIDRTNEVRKYRAALKQAETALAVAVDQGKSAQRMADLRINELAHEIKNPLNSILGFSEMLMTENLGAHSDPRYKDYSANIHEAAQHLLKICTLELDRGKNSADREYQKNDIYEVNVSDVIHHTLDQIKYLADELGVEVKTSISDDFPILKIDPVRLQQVLYNLVSNAIKFTPDGGHVEVKAKVDEVDGAVILVIQDNGFGMSPEDLVMLTEPFIQGDKKSRGDVGAGLGLGIVTRLTKEMGVGFDLRSQENIGTVATLKFEL